MKRDGLMVDESEDEAAAWEEESDDKWLAKLEKENANCDPKKDKTCI